jgi:hypothetical protein
VDTDVLEEHAVYIFRVDPQDGSTMFLWNISIHIQAMILDVPSGLQWEAMQQMAG